MEPSSLLNTSSPTLLQMTPDERRPSSKRLSSEEQQLPCPRCNSTNTKFCYYNNYNLSQPRYFCKSCRRYWTRGGSLRNIPVGGGTRKPTSSNTKKRPRTPTTASKSTPLASSGAGSGLDIAPDPVVSTPAPDNSANFNGGKYVGPNSWWNGQVGVGGTVLPLYGYGYGYGSGHGLGFWDLPMEPVGVVNGGMAGESLFGDTWQMGVGGGAECGEYFGLPDLAISAPAKALE